MVLHNILHLQSGMVLGSYIFWTMEYATGPDPGVFGAQGEHNQYD